MKKYKTLFLLIPLTFFLSCSSDYKEKEINITTGTAGEIYKEALAFAHEEYPESFLLCYMNNEPTIDRANIVPEIRDLTGDLPYWSYVFAKNRQALKDGEANDEDVFSVTYNGKIMALSDYAVMRDMDFDDDAVYGDDLFKYDTDYIFETFMTNIEELYGESNVYHISFRAIMETFEVSVFTSDDKGYSGQFNYEDGSFNYIEPFEIVTY